MTDSAKLRASVFVCLTCSLAYEPTLCLPEYSFSHVWYAYVLICLASSYTYVLVCLHA